MFRYHSNILLPLYVNIYSKKFTDNKRLGGEGIITKKGKQPLMFLKSPKHFKVGKQIILKTHYKFFSTSVVQHFIKFQYAINCSNKALFFIFNKYLSKSTVYSLSTLKYKVNFKIKIIFNWLGFWVLH